MNEEAVLVRVFFPTGDTEGVREAEIMSRSIKAIAFRRDAVDAARKRVTELGKAGVYLLIGPDQDQPDKNRGYIGESEDVGARLKHHTDSGKKEFWQQTIVLVAKDDWLTKAHVCFIESQTMGKVNKTAWIAQNEQSGSNNAGQLPVADKEIVSQFIRQAEVLVGMLGCDIFRPPPTKKGLLPKNVDATLSGPDNALIIGTIKFVNVKVAATLVSLTLRERAGVRETVMANRRFHHRGRRFAMTVRPDDPLN